MLNDLTASMLDKPSIVTASCCVCGRPATNQHHVIIKGMGGTRHEKRIPTVSLCGLGNTSGCHKLAHAMRLHFRYTDTWEYIILPKPTNYADALEMEGWRRCYGC